MRSLAVSFLLLAATIAPACCGVGAGGAKVVFTGQTNLIVWDAARGVEHFVRDARFESRAGSLGFIAPSPGRPTLSAVDPGVFDVLAALEPEPPTRSGMKDDKEATASAPSVQVVEVREVAGYHATVLKATDAGALAQWLKANGYPSPAFLPKWVAPYVARGWYLTAFRVNGEATGPIRMSFRTDRPFNPYAVPEENEGEGASLRLFYVSAGNEVPKIGGEELWRKAEWSVGITPDTAARIAHDIRLASDEMPKNAKVTEYLDSEFGRPGLDDLYFVSEGSTLGRGAWAGVAVLIVLAVARRLRPAKVA